jgi:hypothetical protein
VIWYGEEEVDIAPELVDAGRRWLGVEMRVGEYDLGFSEDSRQSPSLDVRTHLEGLVGQTISTLTGRPNQVIEVVGDDVIVGTKRSPSGRPFQISKVQAAFDELVEKGELAIEVESVGYRSAFIGAVLLSMPGVEQMSGTRRLRFEN